MMELKQSATEELNQQNIISEDLYCVEFTGENLGITFTDDDTKKNLFVKHIEQNSAAFKNNVIIGSKLVKLQGQFVEDLGSKKIYKMFMNKVKNTSSFRITFRKPNDMSICNDMDRNNSTVSIDFKSDEQKQSDTTIKQQNVIKKTAYSDDFTDKHSKLEVQHKQLIIKYHELKSEYTSFKTQHEYITSNLRNKNKELETKCEYLKNEVVEDYNEVVLDMTKQRRKYDKVDENYNKFHDKHETLQKRFNKLTSEHRELRGIMHGLMKQDKEHKRLTTKYHKEYKRLKNKYQNLKAQLTLFEAQHKHITSNLNDKNEKLFKQLHRENKINELLKDKQKMLEREEICSKNEYNALETKYNKLLLDLTECRRKYEQIENDYKQLQANNDAAVQLCERYAFENKAKTKTSNELQIKYEQIENDYKQLQANNDAAVQLCERYAFENKAKTKTSNELQIKYEHIENDYKQSQTNTEAAVKLCEKYASENEAQRKTNNELLEKYQTLENKYQELMNEKHKLKCKDMDKWTTNDILRW
eukprot:418311_1